jgi:hypothetical protein
LSLFSDPSAELEGALPDLWRADASVIAAFAPDKVKVYDVPPTMAPKEMPRHYIILGLIQPLPVDGSDAANTEVTWHVFSLPDPPSKVKAAAIGAATMKAALGIGDLPSHAVQSTLPTETQYLTDPDGVTAHGVLKAEIVTQPKS